MLDGCSKLAELKLVGTQLKLDPSPSAAHAVAQGEQSRVATIARQPYVTGRKVRLEMTTVPKIKSYGDYSSSNYGAHSLQVELGRLTLMFSYQTVVAFEDYEKGLVCSENAWSTTTGKHLNWIQPDKKKRVKRAEFEAQLRERLQHYGLAA